MKLFAPLAVVYVALAVLANWLASKYLWGVPFTDYRVPAGVYAIGIVLVLRDWMQQLKGLWWTTPLIPIAGALSYGIAKAAGWTSLEKIAVASVVAFVISELIETLIFTPIRNRNLTLGVVASGTVGGALDTWIFLTLAFGSASLSAFFVGTFLAKTYMVILGGILTATRRRWAPVPA